MSFGAPELIIVLLIVLLLFGGAKLPKLARSLGEASREFKKGIDDKDKDKDEKTGEGKTTT
ncbi:MAG: twin-arginine translocase TatA/TatE family subunit [Acidimicrobiia bacterium]|nr:twin-arginine translocase TatA/TatE family subunit [Acidimicrobiia bacterium]